MIAPKQNERFLLGSRDLVFPDEIQIRVEPSGTRDGVSQERGLAPSELCVLRYSGEEALELANMALRSIVYNDIGDLTLPLDGSRNMAYLF